jgi:hypothetical protein
MQLRQVIKFRTNHLQRKKIRFVTKDESYNTGNAGGNNIIKKLTLTIRGSLETGNNRNFRHSQTLNSLKVLQADTTCGGRRATIVLINNMFMQTQQSEQK